MKVLFQLLEVIVSANDISDEQKARICKRLGETDKVSNFLDIPTIFKIL